MLHNTNGQGISDTDRSESTTVIERSTHNIITGSNNTVIGHHNKWRRY